MSNNGDFFPLKKAFSGYMREFYKRIYPDTPALQEYVERGLSRSVMWAAGRMVDAVTDMLDSYRKNENSATPDRGALLPVIFVAMARDYTPTTGDVGGRQVGRQLVSFSDAIGASVYGYRQAMGDIRTQIAICAADEASARSIAAQFCLWIGEIPNRRFKVQHTFGQYTIELTAMIDTPDTIFQSVDSGQKNMTILVGDFNLRTAIPYFDAPKLGEQNDGSTNNPPGYPTVTGVAVTNINALTETEVLLPGQE